jgi:hypothetical protein
MNGPGALVEAVPPEWEGEAGSGVATPTGGVGGGKNPAAQVPIESAMRPSDTKGRGGNREGARPARGRDVRRVPGDGSEFTWTARDVRPGTV